MATSQTAFLQPKTWTRYKLLVVLNEIAEVSPQFYAAQRIVMSTNFLGLELRVALQASYALHYGSVVPVNKVRLYYFFTDNVAAVNEVLRQKDV